jgi:hypothetical protein
VRDAYEPYDEGAPQYRRGDWKDVFRTAEAGDLWSPIQTRFFKQVRDVTAQGGSCHRPRERDQVHLCPITC